MYITRPDGTTPFFGDDDGGRLAMLDTRAANDFRPTLATGAALFSRGDYKFVAGDAATSCCGYSASKDCKSTIRSSPTNRPNFHARSATAAISLCVTVGRTNQTTCSSTVDHTARSTADMLMRTRCRLSSRRTAGPCWSIRDLHLHRIERIARLVSQFSRAQHRHSRRRIVFRSRWGVHLETRRRVPSNRVDHTRTATTTSQANRPAWRRSIFFLKGKYWIVRDTNKSVHSTHRRYKFSLRFRNKSVSERRRNP